MNVEIRGIFPEGHANVRTGDVYLDPFIMKCGSRTPSILRLQLEVYRKREGNSRYNENIPGNKDFKNAKYLRAATDV